MIEQVEQDRIKAEKREYIYECLNSAWDLSSYGMGIHFHAVAVLAAGQELTQLMEASLDSPNSNYLIHPYALGWKRNPSFKKFAPWAESPDSAQSLLLLTAMNTRYDQLKREQVLRREETLVSAIRTGVPIDETAFSNEFRARKLEAAVYKLGCMLGLTIQLVYDAKAVDAPVSATYKPEMSTVLDSNWQRLFNEPVPDIGELYQQAHAVFIASADEKDPLVAHLFHIETLPNLAT